MIYVVGAGMAGLSAAFYAVKRGFDVTVLESSARAGGRCHSYFDPLFGAEIDAGTHLMTGANTALTKLLSACPSDAPLKKAGTVFPFFDRGGKSFSIDLTRPLSALPHLPAVWPLLVESVMNTPARKAGKALFLKTAALCFTAKDKNVLLAAPTLKASVVSPVFNALSAKADFRFGVIVRGVTDDKIILDDRTIPLGKDDAVVSTLPPRGTEKETIVNLHFKTDVPLPDGRPFIGLIKQTGHWVFQNDGMLSVTISAASRLRTTDLPAKIWDELKPVLGTEASLPPSRLIAVKRATALQTRRTFRAPIIRKGKIVTAGDTAKTGLPCTIESAVRSGERAALLL